MVLQYNLRRDGLAFKCMGCYTAILERTLGASSLLASGPAGPLACLSLGRIGLAKPSCSRKSSLLLRTLVAEQTHPHDQTSSGQITSRTGPIHTIRCLLERVQMGVATREPNQQSSAA